MRYSIIVLLATVAAAFPASATARRHHHKAHHHRVHTASEPTWPTPNFGRLSVEEEELWHRGMEEQGFTQQEIADLE